jgi:hypothetical protein
MTPYRIHTSRRGNDPWRCPVVPISKQDQWALDELARRREAREAKRNA